MIYRDNDYNDTLYRSYLIYAFDEGYTGIHIH